MQDYFEIFSLAIERIGKNLRRYKDGRAGELGLRGIHVMLLYQLEKSGESGMTAAKLAEACAVNRAFVSRMVVELLEDGFIAYADGEAGGRRYRSRLILTERGRQTVEKMDRRIAEAITDLGSETNARDMVIFYSVLSKIDRRLAALAESVGGD